MTTEELHYEFRRYWNKNSNSHRKSFTDLEVDQLLNVVSRDYVDIFGTGKNPKRYDVGFEVNQQMIDLISTLVVGYPEEPEASLTSLADNIYSLDFADLTKVYRHYVSSLVKDKNCGLIDVSIEQHGDMATVKYDYHRSANKRFKRIPATIRNKKLFLYANSDFDLTGIQITYIKSPDEICLGTYGYAPTVADPSPVGTKPASSTDIDENYHDILVNMAVQEAARIYGDVQQLQIRDNKLTDIT